MRATLAAVVPNLRGSRTHLGAWKRRLESGGRRVGAAASGRGRRTIAAVSHRRSLVVLALAATLLVASCSKTEARPEVREELVPTATSTVAPAPITPPPVVPDPEPVDWQPCGEIECGVVTVPLDYDDPAGRQIDLAVARRVAADPEERIGPLAVNPGGPGGSGVDLVRAGAFAELADHFDLVSWDPRGVGGTEPLVCGADTAGFLGLDPHPDTPTEQAELEETAEEIAGACGEEDAELLRHLDTVVTAHDLEQIRRAIGGEPLNYLGFSYGTLIGLEYARTYPAELRTLTLDGVVDPAMTLEEMLTGQAIAMEAFLAEMAPLYDQVMARAEDDPLVLADGREAGPDIVVLAAIAATYQADGKAVLRDALEDAAEGYGEPLADLARQYINASDSFGAYVGVVCTDGQRPTGIEAWRDMAARVAELAPRLGEAAINEVLACAYWPTEPTAERRPVSPAGLAPALVIGTTGDAATPYDDAVTVATNLPGAALLTFESDGHTAYGGSPCVDGVVRRYLVDLELPEPGSVCEA
jgi:pimeloyl-ACP methyl ester carboxylesterase